MGLISIFSFRDYKLYLKAIQKITPHNGRGFRARLSRAIRSQSAYVSQVLNGSAHFSLEQACALNQYLEHSRNEARFFICLVEYSRANTPELKMHFRELLQELIDTDLNLKKQFGIKDVLSVEEQSVYYSNWIYAAVHIATTINALSTSKAIAECLGLPPGQVSEILTFLKRSKLVVESLPGHFRVGNGRIHIGTDSKLVSQNHINWRIQAINSMERDYNKDFHYTSVVSLSHDDVLKIKTDLVNYVKQFNSVVEGSAEETLQCINLDFFSLTSKSVRRE
jgi:uncharacterized protein (TIGR02147 family)